MRAELPDNYPNLLLLREFTAHDTAEEKLTWLMDRESPAAQLADSEMTAEKRIPGCLSGLWLKGESSEGKVSFFGRSDSPMVQGVVCFLCELCSGVSPVEVSVVTSSISASLGLEGLLSTTRKRAVASTLSFMRSYAASAAASDSAP